MESRSGRRKRVDHDDHDEKCGPSTSTCKKVKLIVEKVDVKSNGQNEGVNSVIDVNDIPIYADTDADNENLNPFLLAPVLKIMMNNMTVEDLKISRMVCQTWDDLALHHLKLPSSRIKTLILKTPESVQKFTQTLEASTRSSQIIPIINKFSAPLQLLSKQRKRFYDQYSPHLLCCKIVKSDTLLNVTNLLFNVASCIKTIKFEGFLHFPLAPGVKEKIKWPKEFPLLEEIIFDLDSGLENKNDINFLIQKVGVRAPKLKSIGMMNYHQTLGAAEADTLLSSSKICNLPQKLQTLFISYGYSTSHRTPGPNDLYQISQAGLHLKNFGIRIYFVYNNNELLQEYFTLLQDFLKAQSQSLELLEFNMGIEAQPHIRDVPKFILPHLPNLKVLHIGNEIQFDDYVPYNLINLSCLYPNLKEVVLHFNSASWSKILTPASPIETVEKLTIKYSVILNSDKTNFQMLDTYFPKIKFLCIDSTLIISKSISKMIEEGYTTIPWKNQLKKLIIKPSRYYKSAFFNGFSHLKALERLELVNEADTTNQRVQYFSMSTLKRLKITSIRIKNLKLQDRTVEEIRKHFLLDYTVAGKWAESCEESLDPELIDRYNSAIDNYNRLANILANLLQENGIDNDNNIDIEVDDE